ncbi:MAG: hypothetical protein K940chlam3_00201 [Chlamydiae bacterium]|nr:hypothetical protein [Chlamydiota bacterium]
MEFDTSLTNEKIKKKFKSQFELVNYLINQARDMIKSGRQSRVDVDSDNVAVNIVAEFIAGKDQPEELELDQVDVINNEDMNKEEASPENS